MNVAAIYGTVMTISCLFACALCFLAGKKMKRETLDAKLLKEKNNFDSAYNKGFHDGVQTEVASRQRSQLDYHLGYSEAESKFKKKRDAKGHFSKISSLTDPENGGALVIGSGYDAGLVDLITGQRHDSGLIFNPQTLDLTKAAE